MTIYFTSDTHFGHRNIIEYCKRPFVDVDDMNIKLAAAWNSVVGSDDVVYHLGDFAMGDKSKWAGYCAGLNGHKILVSGNHDGSVLKMLALGFDVVYKFDAHQIIELDGYKLLLNHMPIPEHKWPAGTDYHLFGHVHEAMVRRGEMINVGVDVRDFRPVTLAELLKE